MAWGAVICRRHPAGAAKQLWYRNESAKFGARSMASQLRHRPRLCGALAKRKADMEATEPSVRRRVTVKTAPCSLYRLELKRPAEVEQACGGRYRKQVSDQGMGHGRRGMMKRLRVWGSDATQRACRDWLQRYRLGDGAVDGTASLHELCRQDLQRWYQAKGFAPQQLQERCRKEAGAFADASNLVRWLTAPEQALSILDDNTDMHSHACGEYALEQLQQGVSSAVVAQQLPSLYLAKATAQRTMAYRRYRESIGAHWTVEQLARLHWEAQHEEVSLERQLGVNRNRMSHSRLEQHELNLRLARATPCTQLGIPQESVLLE